MQKIIRDEIDKLLEAGFIRKVEYLDWLANVVVVPKKEGKWQVCVDYTNLNNACPKDSFPLLRIDQIVDSIAEQGMLSFLDAFSGYYQIPMAPTDEEKTAFITPHELYYYKVMLFGLKNDGATYQRLMTKIFKPLVGRTVEVYIDDIVVKSKTRGEHALHLQEVFHFLREYDMKLNPSKCAFGVSAGKFLGKLVALGCFITRFTDELRPFFLALRKAGVNGWTDSCQSAFEKIKHYLMQPPILSSPLPREKLYMYLAVSEWAISAVLFCCPSHKEQKPIYYVSRALVDVETRYSKMEQTALALRSAAQKLRPYFQAHSVVVLTDQPLHNILHKPDLTRRMLQWAIELSKPTQHKEPREEEWWTLLVDGASRSSGFGVGLLLQSPTGEQLEQAIRLGFPVSNNEIEYEKEYETKDERMARYLTKVRDTLQRFAEWTIKKIKRIDNGCADALAGIAASLPIKEAILLPVHVQTNPSVTEAPTCNTIEASQANGQKWTEAIIRYLRIGTLLEEPKQAHKTRRSISSASGPLARILLAHDEKDAAAYVKKCDKCQRHAHIPHVPSKTLKPIFGPWPFVQWGMDIVRPLPIATTQKKFLLVATDYFSKWVEAEAYASIKDKDNLYSTPRYPQSNGQAKATNKTLVTALKKRLEQAKGKWVEKLPGALWAYRTTPGRPIGNTPFALTYGMDAVIPTEIGLPTTRTEARQQSDANVEL
ncbi:Retrovirus-related Pol polyprotein from transposon 17.6 [Vitis vinifera]|uniref:Retrovirus-related Pol polyprotein from transposon 17.6 n=1 Tax=Vitis vinifera TaxID=29760 RepID=A0A438F399_VITVI|nr:Retrovirus-related Pol polyprotein from transposon 17.6 [Vitis vinifera]